MIVDDGSLILKNNFLTIITPVASMTSSTSRSGLIAFDSDENYVYSS